MASVKVSFDSGSSLHVETSLQHGYSAKTIIVFLLTSLFCAATVVAVGDDATHALGYAILANLVNFIHLLPFYSDLAKLSKGKVKSSFIPQGTFALCCIAVVSSLNTLTTIKQNLLVGSGMLLLALRSTLALLQFWCRGTGWIKHNLFDDLALVTGLKICQEISENEYEKYSSCIGEDGELTEERGEVNEKGKNHNQVGQSYDLEMEHEATSEVNGMLNEEVDGEYSKAGESHGSENGEHWIAEEKGVFKEDSGRKNGQNHNLEVELSLEDDEFKADNNRQPSDNEWELLKKTSSDEEEL